MILDIDLRNIIMLTQAGTLVKYKIGPPLKPSRAAENLATTKLPKMVNCALKDILKSRTLDSNSVLQCIIFEGEAIQPGTFFFPLVSKFLGSQDQDSRKNSGIRRCGYNR